MSILSHSNALRKISEKSYTTPNALKNTIQYSLIARPLIIFAVARNDCRPTRFRKREPLDLTSQVMRCIIPRCEVNRRLRAFGHEESPGTVGQGAG